MFKLPHLTRSLGFALLIPVGAVLAVAPPWWQDRGVIAVNPSTGDPQPADDYRLVNIGQVKQIATQAAAELDARLPGGAGSAIHAIVDPWPTATVQAAADDYHTVNQGQVKTLAKLFFDRLNQEGYIDSPTVTGQTYPWTAVTTDDDDYRYANIGQVKTLFSFELAKDTDGDGVPDWRERAEGTLPNDPTSNSLEPASLRDSDGDGVPDDVEIAQLTDPYDRDSDGDGFWDGADADPNDPGVKVVSTSGDATAPVIVLTRPLPLP